MKNILNNIRSGQLEKELWDECLFVFDSSALLNFYEYSDTSRKQIYKTIFKRIKNRLWITNQTEYEYLKNRESVLLKPQKLYNELNTTYFDAKQFQVFKNQYQQLKNRTKKSDKHPYIRESFFKDLDAQFVEFEKHLNIFFEKFKKQIDNKKDGVEKMKLKDTVHIAFQNFFKVSDGYDYNKLLEIVKEGELRYRNTVPPGYEDLKEKSGFQIYGDLIIWKQILDIALKNKKPIILVIDDLKIDWCYKNQKDKNIIDSPREELIKEMLDIGGVKFWAYSSTQFLQKSNEMLGTIITEEIITEVKTSNQFSMASKVEELVFNWAVQYFKSDGEVEYVGGNKDYGVDLLLKNEESKIGIEIKYYPRFRLQSIKSLTERLHPRFKDRGYFDKFDDLIIIIACETEELANKMAESKEKYEKSEVQPMNVKIGYINSEMEFELLE